jgi:parallel beta-helix repeat protein
VRIHNAPQSFLRLPHPIYLSMKNLRFLPLLALFASAFLNAADTPPPPVPPAAAVAATGSSLIVSDWTEALVRSGPKNSEYGSAEPGPTSGAIKLTTFKKPANVFNLQAILLNESAIKTGDTLFIRFAARSIKAEAATGVTKLRVGFSRNSPPWEGSYNGELGLTSEWQRFDIPFTAKNDFAAREAKFSFMFGYADQTLEIADVQFLRYGPEVSVASLPKTRRFADKISPDVIKSELGRIGALRTQLASVADPSPAHGRTLHVSPKGSATGKGTKSKPFATIPQALAVVQPGDTILVADGEYRDPKGIEILTSGRPDAWIKLKAAPGARPRLISSYWSGIEIRSGVAYIEISGFDLRWVADPAVKSRDGGAIHGSGIAMMYGTHHVRVLDNIVQGFGTGGIITLDCDYIHIEGNIVHDTCKTSPYGGSAISLCRAFDFDQGQGYRNVIRGNVLYDNELQVVTQVTSGGTGRTLTDGNGIIIDVFNKSRANPLIPHGLDRTGPLAPYTGRTLVENNLIYNNGGRGIHVFRSSYVDVLHNTTYMNQKSADINAGEYTAIESSHVVFANNIGYGRKDKRANSQDGSSRVVWYNNLFFNSADILVHDGLLEADPLFAAAGLTAKPEGFRLLPGSPALKAGVLTNAVNHGTPAPIVDFNGKLLAPDGPVDLGAYQHP